MQNLPRRRAAALAFPKTLPVFAGYCFLGMTYGIYLRTSGLPVWYVILMNLTIFSGSAEMLAVEMMLDPFNPWNALAIAVMTGARYLFYGVSMLDRYKGTGWKKFYLIYGMVDETFSINYQTILPPDVDRGWFLFFVTLFDHLYWIFGAVSGTLLGSLLFFNTEGLDFVTTAMFTVIFMNQWMTEKRHASELIGIAASAACLILIGAERFIIPAMALILVILTAARKPLTAVAEENTRFHEEQEAAK